MAYTIGFFNGVWNTRKDAELSLKALKSNSLIGSTYNSSPIIYQLFYNTTGCSSTKANCSEDISETFIQRSNEMDGILSRRWEYFWEQVTRRSNSPQSLTRMLTNKISNQALTFAQLFEALRNAVSAKILSFSVRMEANPPTTSDVQKHVNTLMNYGQRGYRAILIGHSQGNLFANAAYDGYLSKSRQRGITDGHDTGYVAATVIHIAPASASLRGPHVLAEIDIVINALRLLNSGPIATNTLDTSQMPTSIDDISGHRLIETYLDPQRSAHDVIKKLITESLDSL